MLKELASRLPASLELTLCGLVFACSIAIPLGVIAATRPGSWVDHLCRVLATAGVSLPTFFTGLLLAYIFYYLLGLAPSPLGRLDVSFSAPPTVTGLYLIDSLIARDLELFARLREAARPALGHAGPLRHGAAHAHDARVDAGRALVRLHPHGAGLAGCRARRCSTPTRSATRCCRSSRRSGMVFSFLLGSNVLVEKVFAWPGIGSYVIEALIASDYAPVQGFVLTMALLYVLLNLSIDMLYGVIDPRVSVEG